MCTPDGDEGEGLAGLAESTATAGSGLGGPATAVGRGCESGRGGVVVVFPLCAAGLWLCFRFAQRAVVVVVAITGSPRPELEGLRRWRWHWDAAEILRYVRDGPCSIGRE